MSSSAASAGVTAELSRERNIARLSAETFDLAVIGGGINGAAIARDAAMRGLGVALIDSGDFAGATSSRSSKLIHGGLRYLPQGHLRLVYQALRERELLRHRTAPHLVHPIWFLFPSYRRRRPGRLALSCGLMLYDRLARMPPAERHRRLNAGAVNALEPILAPDNLTGGVLYLDGWGDDARLTIENALDAAINGAAVANYVAVEGLARVGSRLAAAAVCDRCGGAAFDLRARHFVNAAGPWLDDIRRMDDADAQPMVRLTKGVHLVVEAARLPLHNSLVLSDGAGRIVFAIPREGWVMIGTTDTDFAGDRAAVATAPEDIAYLLAVVNQALPSASIDERDVAFSFAGLRALARNNADISPSLVSREEVMLESRSGLLSVAGGKLTTHREIAERIVDKVVARMGRPSGICPTLTTPLPGARGPTGLSQPESAETPMAALADDLRAVLTGRYGTRAPIVAAVARERPDLAARLVPGAPAIGAEVLHAIRNEFATSVSDFLLRRSAMVWRDPASAVAAASVVAHIMAKELGWSAGRIEAEIEDFFKNPAFHRQGNREVNSDRNDVANKDDKD